MSKFLRVDFEIQPWGCARVDGIDMIASLSVHEVRSLSGGMGDVVAVSHVWGNAQCLVENVKGASHGIKISSPKKMERLLNIAKSEGWENLWLDNICINQEDNAEKAREVMRMGSVYRETRATLVLLDSTRSELLEVARTYLLIPQNQRSLCLYACMERNGDMELLVGKLMELAQDSWYERLWTVQESALATSIYMAPIDKDIAYDVSGFKQCRAFWVRMFRFLGRLWNDRCNVSPDHHLFRNFVNRWLCSIRKCTMGNALQVNTDVRCSVRKDRVYGILGLVPNSKIIPAYGDTTEAEVAVMVMKDCVNNLKEMDLFYLRGPKLEELGKCMVLSWESLVAPKLIGLSESFVHHGNCMYDENVGLRVSNPRLFIANVVATVELDRSGLLEDRNLRCRALFKALKEKLHDDEILVELIRGAMVLIAHAMYREEFAALEYFKKWKDIFSSPSHIRAYDVLKQKYDLSMEDYARFESLWLTIDHIEWRKTYILSISKVSNCPGLCCKRTYISLFHSNEHVEDNLIVMDYGGRVSTDFVLEDEVGKLEDIRVPVMVLEPMQEGLKFISGMVMDQGFRHESEALEIDAITVV